MLMFSQNKPQSSNTWGQSLLGKSLQFVSSKEWIFLYTLILYNFSGTHVLQLPFYFNILILFFEIFRLSPNIFSFRSPYLKNIYIKYYIFSRLPWSKNTNIVPKVGVIIWKMNVLWNLYHVGDPHYNTILKVDIFSIRIIPLTALWEHFVIK